MYLILTDIVGIAMLIFVAAVGTDLAESLILPGLVVELAEILAISEILMSREMRKSRENMLTSYQHHSTLTWKYYKLHPYSLQSY